MPWIALRTGVTAADATPIDMETFAVPLPAGPGTSFSRESTLTTGTLRIASTAGTGTLLCAGKLFGKYPIVYAADGTTVALPARWVPLGTADTGEDAERGMVNGGYPIGENAEVAEEVNFVEQVQGWDMCTHLAFRFTTPTAGAFNGEFAVAFGAPDVAKDI